MISDEDRPDLGAMAMWLARRLIALEQPILDRHGVSMWAYAVLSALRSGPARAQATLAASIGADKTRLIGVLDDLQQRALIDRVADPADRRVRLLSLTPDGLARHRLIQAEIRAAEATVLAGLTAADRDTFVRALLILSVDRHGS